jgi:Zn-dependent protease with chaperone function
MTNFPSRNTRISLIGLVVLGTTAVGGIAYNIDRWLAGGAAVKRVVQACDVLGTGCASAVTSIFKIIGSPQQLLLTLALLALALALIKIAAVIVSARYAVANYKHPVESFPKAAAVIEGLGAKNIRVKIADTEDFSAFTHGILKPTICLSRGIIDTLNNGELAALIAHEVGHVRRRDNLAIFLALFIRDFLWPLPISHHLFSIFIQEKEYAADDFAVELTGNPLELASAIVSVAKRLKNSMVQSPAYATFFPNAATAKSRVGRLLGSNEKIKPSIFKLSASVAASILIVAAVASLAYAQPVIGGAGYERCGMGSDCVQRNYSCCSQK